MVLRKKGLMAPPRLSISDGKRSIIGAALLMFIWVRISPELHWAPLRKSHGGTPHLANQERIASNKLKNKIPIDIMVDGHFNLFIFGREAESIHFPPAAITPESRFSTYIDLFTKFDSPFRTQWAIRRIPPAQVAV